jgi:hypothetical protein
MVVLQAVSLTEYKPFFHRSMNRDNPSHIFLLMLMLGFVFRIYLELGGVNQFWDGALDYFVGEKTRDRIDFAIH